MKTFKTMLKTELKLSLRGMDMFIFAICVPLVVLAVMGIIYGNRPAFSGAGYSFLEQSFGAVTTISICAGGVMGLPLVVSDYRSKGILKRYKVTPASPSMILAGTGDNLYFICGCFSDPALCRSRSFLWISVPRIFFKFSGMLSPGHCVYVQHRHAGRRYCSEY